MIEQLTQETKALRDFNELLSMFSPNQLGIGEYLIDNVRAALSQAPLVVDAEVLKKLLRRTIEVFPHHDKDTAIYGSEFVIDHIASTYPNGIVIKAGG